MLVRDRILVLKRELDELVEWDIIILTESTENRSSAQILQETVDFFKEYRVGFAMRFEIVDSIA